MKKLLCVVALASILAGCKTSPTGRTQIALYSEQQMNQLGGQSFSQMKEQQVISQDAKTQEYVQCIADALIAQLPANYANQSWEVVVFEEESANAFALPGGKIGVHTGMLKVAENEHQLAAVMGHEVGHVIAEHANERVSQNSLLQVGLQVGGTLMQQNDVAYRNELMQALGLGAQVGIALPFSRTHEKEADIIGLDLMAKAGFNPEGAVALWHNMSKIGGGERPPEFMSTHPAPETRIAELTAKMPEAKIKMRDANNQGRTPRCNQP